MRLKNLVKNKKDLLIEVRTNYPEDETRDILFGYAKWNGKDLESLDNDDYYLDEEVYKYEFWRDGGGENLTIWIKSEWISG